MIVNFVKQIFRTPIKTIIFVILISIVCVLLSVGSLMYVCSNQELQNAKENFEAEIRVENIEDINNPLNDISNNINIKELSPLLNSKYVGHKYIQKRLVGHGENFVGYHDRLSMYIYDIYPYATFDVEIKDIKYSEEYNGQQYTAKLLNVLGGTENYKEINFIQNTKDFDLEKDKLQVGKRYVINCDFIYKTWAHQGNLYDNCRIYDDSVYYNMITFKSEKDNTEYKFYEVKNDNYKSNEDFKPYLDYANALSLSDGEVNTWYGNNMSDFKQFYNKKVTVFVGREITKEEFKSGAKVCLISDNLYSKNNINIGDKLKLKVRDNKNKYVEYTDLPQDLENARLKNYDKAETVEYEVVGAYKGNTYDRNVEIIDYPQNIIYVPDKTLPKEFLEKDEVENIATDQLSLFLSSYNNKKNLLNELKENGFNFDKYNVIIKTQGADAINNTFKEMKQTSIIMLSSCLVVAFIIIFFIVFLYINKRTVDAAIMVAFGTKQKKILAGFLISIIIIILTGSVIGVAIGCNIAENIVNEAYQNVKESLSTTGHMFSSAYSYQYAAKFDKTVQIPFAFPIIIIGIITVLSIVMGSIGSYFTLNKKPIELLTAKE